MNTTELLQIVEPHREMLKGMGWTVEDNQHPDNVTLWRGPGGHRSVGEDLPADLAARILCDVAMEALEKWGAESTDRLLSTGPCANGKHFAQFDGMKGYEEPTRLAALLALLAWTQEDRT